MIRHSPEISSPVLSSPSFHAGPFGTTDFICRNSSTLSSPPTIVNPKPRDDLTSWQRRRSPRKRVGSRVKNGTGISIITLLSSFRYSEICEGTQFQNYSYIVYS